MRIDSTATHPSVAISQPSVQLSAGDPMPRIILTEASGGQFDSWHQRAAGSARVYWVGAPHTASVVARLAAVLETYETDLRVVTLELPEVPDGNPTWLLDPAGELSQAFAATGPLAVVVDASGRVAERLTAPTQLMSSRA